MSMNLFLKAFTAEQIEAMKNDHALIDSWILDNKNYSESTDTETAWDALNHLLSGQGFASDVEVDDALFNGCSIISPVLVKKQADELAKWTNEALLESLRELDIDSDIYHIESWKDEDGEEDLLDQFNKFRNFFINASKNNWGIVSYVA